MAFTSPSTELSQAILTSGNMTVIDILDGEFADVQVSAPALQPLTQLFNGQGRNETLQQVDAAINLAEGWLHRVTSWASFNRPSHDGLTKADILHQTCRQAAPAAQLVH